MSRSSPEGEARLPQVDSRCVDEILRSFDSTHRPGGVVAIAVQGRPVYVGAFGLANAEARVPLAPGTRLRTCSGLLVCLAYLLLCEDGKASLDDPIGKRMPELHPVARQVTARQLMSHSGGLRDPFDICLQLCGVREAPPAADLLSLCHSIDDLSAAPGVTWTYNAGAYLMLRVLIERTIDGPLESFLQGRILTPAGLWNTVPVRLDTRFIPNSAALHATDSAGRYRKSSLHSALAGECGLVTTAEDMLRLNMLMDGHAVGSAETWKALSGPMTLANGTDAGIGLGLIRERYRGHELMWHGGTIWGGDSQMVRVPDASMDVVVLLNRDDTSAGDIVRRILDACLTDRRPSRRAADARLPPGSYRSSKAGTIVEIQAGRHQNQIVSVDGLDIPFTPDHEGIFWPSPPWAFLRQCIRLGTHAGGSGTPSFMNFGELDELSRLPAPSMASGAPPLGRYYSSSTGITITLSEREGARVMRSEGRFGAVVCELQPVADGIWRRKSEDCLIGGIVAAADGGAALYFSTWRNRRLVFRRL